MDLETEYQLAQLALRRSHLPVFVNIQVEFNSGIAQLGLEDIQKVHVLAQPEGRHDLRQRINAAGQLLALHKQLFQTAVTALVNVSVKSADILPEPRRTQELDAMQAMIQLKMTSQGAFYQRREAWAAAANALLGLLDAHPDSFRLQDDRLVYSSQLYHQVIPHIREINRIAVKEQAAHNS